MSLSLSRCSRQEGRGGDRVLLGAVRDGCRAGAGRFERRPGQSSRQSGLRVHRRPHGAAHRAPVEHHQVTLTHR